MVVVTVERYIEVISHYGISDDLDSPWKAIEAPKSSPEQLSRKNIAMLAYQTI